MKTTKAKQSGKAGPLSRLSSGSPGTRIERDTMGELPVPLTPIMVSRPPGRSKISHQLASFSSRHDPRHGPDQASCRV